MCGVQPNFLLIAVTLPTRLKRKNRSKMPSDWNFMRDAVVIYPRKNGKDSRRVAIKTVQTDVHRFDGQRSSSTEVSVKLLAAACVSVFLSAV